MESPDRAEGDVLSSPVRRARVAAPHADRGKTQKGLRKSREAWFSRLAGIFQRPQAAPDLWGRGEELLLGADVGVHTAMALLDRLRVRSEEKRGEDLLALLKEEMCALLQLPGEHVPEVAPAPPHVVMVVGVNGAGKTTSIAKLSAVTAAKGSGWCSRPATPSGRRPSSSCSTGASRSVRRWSPTGRGPPPAQWPMTLSRPPGPGAPTFSSWTTAGRLHTKSHLMEEMAKVRRVLSRLDSTAPHEVILVLDATTGQNGLAQAQAFTTSLGCHGIFLAKLDGTAKGGIPPGHRRPAPPARPLRGHRRGGR